MIERCTFVNVLCPGDLCVMEYGHANADINRHITGTMYGSAHTPRNDQLRLLHSEQTQWHTGFMAPRGTTHNQLIRMGWIAQDIQDAEREKSK